MDEPDHIYAGYQQVFHHRIQSDTAHPPLAKELAGIGLLTLQPRPSDPPIPEAHAFLSRNRISPDAILAASRTPMLLFYIGTVLVAFSLGRRLFGEKAGLLAASFTAFEPNLLAHAGVVATDAPVTFFWIAVIAAWERLLDGRTVRRVALAGAALGGALATKFSAVYLLPTLALISVGVRAVEAAERPKGDRLRAMARGFGRDMTSGLEVGSIAFVVLIALYAPAVSGMSHRERQEVVESRVGAHPSPLGAVLRGIAPTLPGAALFGSGLLAVADENAARAGVSFLCGRVAFGSFPSYFFVALAVKSTFALLTAAGLALALVARRRTGRVAAVLWLPIGYYLFFSISSGYNIGVRHILPIYPLLAVAASNILVCVQTDSPRKLRRLAGFAALVFAAAQLYEAWDVHPHELSYFNALAGSTSRGWRVLSDSNTDWGLDLLRLRAWMQQRGIREATIAYFGGDDVYSRFGFPDFAAYPVLRGRIVAISTTFWEIAPAYFAVYGRPDLSRAFAGLIHLLKTRARLVGQIGGSTLIFELPAPPRAEAAVPRPSR